MSSSFSLGWRLQICWTLHQPQSWLCLCPGGWRWSLRLCTGSFGFALLLWALRSRMGACSELCSIVILCPDSGTSKLAVVFSQLLLSRWLRTRHVSLWPVANNCEAWLWVYSCCMLVIINFLHLVLWSDYQEVLQVNVRHLKADWSWGKLSTVFLLKYGWRVSQPVSLAVWPSVLQHSLWQVQPRLFLLLHYGWTCIVSCGLQRQLDAVISYMLELNK